MDLRSFNENIEEIQIDKGKRKKKTVLTDNQIEYITGVFRSWQSADDNSYTDIAEFCQAASLEEIRAKDYSLAPSKYIKFIDHDLDIDYEKEMNRIQKEMQNIMISEKASQNMLEDAFRGIGYGID